MNESTDEVGGFRRLITPIFEGRPRPPLNALEGYAHTAAAPPLRAWECLGDYDAIGTSFAMAHMNASSSRAIAVVTMLACLPRAMSRR